MKRLEWGDIDFAEGFIDLRAAITKRGRKRSIPIDGASAAWLASHTARYGIQSGPIAPWSGSTLRRRLRRLHEVAGVERLQNGLRHTFASYWLATHEDLTRLAVILGHAGGLDVLHRHYHRAVKKREAERLWKIRPGVDAVNVIPMSSRAA